MSLVDVMLRYFRVQGMYKKSGSILDVLSSHTNSLTNLYILTLGAQDAVRFQKNPMVCETSADTPGLCSDTPASLMQEGCHFGSTLLGYGDTAGYEHSRTLETLSLHDFTANI